MTHTHQLYACLLLALYLAPCAWQDWRTRKVSNWLTVPAFVVAWPLAIWLGNLEWTVAVFLGCYVAWQFKGMGAADGKLATLMAAVSPVATVFSVIVLGAMFLGYRVLYKQSPQLPAAVAFHVAAIVAAIMVLGEFVYSSFPQP